MGKVTASVIPLDKRNRPEVFIDIDDYYQDERGQWWGRCIGAPWQKAELIEKEKP